MPTTIDIGYQRCTELAQSHYENFPVGRLVSAHLRPHVHAVYAFSRVADDLADEGYADPRLKKSDDPPILSQEARLKSLQNYRNTLTAALEGQLISEDYAWIFLPLLQTINELQLTPKLFYDLLSAFEQDITKRRYADFSEVHDYCQRSANPIGRLVLQLHGYGESELLQLSDCICTGLQLANFWQDVSVDLGKDRIYLPQTDLAQFHVSEQDLFQGRSTPEYRQLIQFQVERTWEFFYQGKTLPKHLSAKLSWEIRMTWLGGTKILEKIATQNYDTLSRRPKLSKWELFTLLLRSFVTR